MRRHSTGGVYLNFSGFAEEGQALLPEAHGADYTRLLALKRRYHPDNLFRLGPVGLGPAPPGT